MLEAEAQIVLDVFRGDQTEKSFGIILLNGTGITGEAGRIANELISAGFRVAETGNATSFDIERTTIYYDALQKESAFILESHLLSGAVLLEREEETGLGIEMVFGRDYEGVSEVPVESESEEERSIGTLGSNNEEIRLRYQSEINDFSAKFVDSIVLTNAISDEQDIDAALQRAGKIRGC
tara:strand:+ start:579 stop:1121 length:543 start_codon:yes stop_codon:yes gene_type:complete